MAPQLPVNTNGNFTALPPDAPPPAVGPPPATPLPPELANLPQPDVPPDPMEAALAKLEQQIAERGKRISANQKALESALNPDTLKQMLPKPTATQMLSDWMYNASQLNLRNKDFGSLTGQPYTAIEQQRLMNAKDQLKLRFQQMQLQQNAERDAYNAENQNLQNQRLIQQARMQQERADDDRAVRESNLDRMAKEGQAKIAIAEGNLIETMKRTATQAERAVFLNRKTKAETDLIEIGGYEPVKQLVKMTLEDQSLTKEQQKEEIFRYWRMSREGRGPHGSFRQIVTPTGELLGYFNPTTLTFAPPPGEGLRQSPLPSGENLRRAVATEMINQATTLVGLGERHKDRIGPVIGHLTAAELALLGSSDPEIVELFRISGNLGDMLLRARSGAQINEHEYNRLSKLVPDPRTPYTTFSGRLNDFLRESRSILGTSTGGRLSATPKQNPAPISPPATPGAASTFGGVPRKKKE